MPMTVEGQLAEEALFPDCSEQVARVLEMLEDGDVDDQPDEFWNDFYRAWSDGLFLLIERCCDDDGAWLDVATRQQRLAGFEPERAFALEVFVAEQAGSPHGARLVRLIFWSMRMERGERASSSADERSDAGESLAAWRSRRRRVRLPAGTRARFLFNR